MSPNLTRLNKPNTDMHANQTQRYNGYKQLACWINSGRKQRCVWRENRVFLCLSLQILYSLGTGSPEPKRLIFTYLAPTWTRLRLIPLYNFRHIFGIPLGRLWPSEKWANVLLGEIHSLSVLTWVIRASVLKMIYKFDVTDDAGNTHL